MGLAYTIASRSLRERPGRTLFCTLGIALGIATVVGVVTLDFNTILGMSQRQQLDGNPDLEVRPVAGGAQDASELASMAGVASASAFFQKRCGCLARGRGCRRQGAAHSAHSIGGEDRTALERLPFGRGARSRCSSQPARSARGRSTGGGSRTRSGRRAGLEPSTPFGAQGLRRWSVDGAREPDRR